MHARMYVCMYAYMHVCMYAYMHVCMYACTCTYRCRYTYIYIGYIPDPVTVKLDYTSILP